MENQNKSSLPFLMVEAIKRNRIEKERTELEDIQAFVQIYGNTLEKSIFSALKISKVTTPIFSTQLILDRFIRDLKDQLTDNYFDEDELYEMRNLAEKTLTHWGLVIDINGINLTEHFKEGQDD
jgi:hypothetical protein